MVDAAVDARLIQTKSRANTEAPRPDYGIPRRRLGIMTISTFLQMKTNANGRTSQSYDGAA